MKARRTCRGCDAPLPHGTRKLFCEECRLAKSRRRVRDDRTAWRGFTPKDVICAECGGAFKSRSPGARFCSDPCRNRHRERTRPSMAERGYGREHFRLRAAWKPQVATGTVACARCGELIAPGERWDLDHDDNDRSSYLGPSHARCNRATTRHRVEREQGLGTSREW
jgi:predicted nucleic acid-binding Zn ribbon protein